MSTLRVGPSAIRPVAALALAASLAVAACGAGAAAPAETTALSPSAAPLGTLTQQAFIGFDKAFELASGFGSVWSSGFYGEMSNGTVTRIDPATNTVVASIDVSPTTGGIAADDTSLWIVDGDAKAIREIDPATNTLTDRSVPVHADGGGLVYQGGRLWFVGWDQIGPVDPVKGTFTPMPLLGGCGDGCGFVATDDALYKLREGAVYRFSIDGKKIDAKNEQDATGALLALGKDGLYAASTTASVVLLDPETLAVKATFTAQPAVSADGGKWSLGNVPGGGGQFASGALVADDTGAWVRFSSPIVARVTPARGDITLYGTFPTESDGPTPIMVSDGSLWVTNQGAGSGGADGGKPGVYRLALP